MLCFSYGSNMSSARLRARVPSARFVAVATLPAHRLQFHKVSLDGSAKCDAEETGSRADQVIGVVYDIAADDKPLLDGHEGLGAGYDLKEVAVVAPQGALSAFLYFATRVDPDLKPYSWYKEHVLIGAREHALPSGYIAQIEAVQALMDPIKSRHERELAIYR